MTFGNSSESPSDDTPAILVALPWVLIFSSISITAANLVVLTAFFQNPKLRTPFNVYLVFLSLSNLGQAVLDLPLTVVSDFSPVWPLGRIACNFNLYAKWVLAALVRNTHALISINRIWALFLPITYKNYHTRSVAIGLCLGLVVYVHSFLLPGLIADDLYYRVDERLCLVNTTADYYWALPTQIILYDSTLIIIVVSYPFIVWKLKKRRNSKPTNNPAPRLLSVPQQSKYQN